MLWCQKFSSGLGAGSKVRIATVLAPHAIQPNSRAFSTAA